MDKTEQVLWSSFNRRGNWDLKVNWGALVTNPKDGTVCGSGFPTPLWYPFPISLDTSLGEFLNRTYSSFILGILAQVFFWSPGELWCSTEQKSERGGKGFSVCNLLYTRWNNTLGRSFCAKHSTGADILTIFSILFTPVRKNLHWKTHCADAETKIRRVWVTCPRPTARIQPLSTNSEATGVSTSSHCFS